MLKIGSIVDGKYKILSKVGQGGMSVVYMAVNEKAKKTFAVKEIRKDCLLDIETVNQGLIAEVDILKKINHPNLPQIADVIETKDSLIIVMDYIQGESLNQTLLENGAQPQDLVVKWAKQLCGVLGYLHSRKPPIIYRDMKPSNIMLKPDGNVTLIDFGTARKFKERNVADTTCLGTVGYAAPEQFGGMGQSDARTDIYCLGATMYHLITGADPSEPPYEMYPICVINQSLSSGLEKIIIKCTKKNPDERYQSAEELLFALEHIEENDDKYRKKQKKRLGLFISSGVLSIAFFIGGFAVNYAAQQLDDEGFQDLYMEALKTHDYNEKIQLFEQCISIAKKSNVKDAYMGLINSYKENDSVFSDEEAKHLERLISDNKDLLMSDSEGYAEVCFETGKLFWYYYGYISDDVIKNQITRANNSGKWFQDVKKYASSDYDNLSMAEVYVDICSFYSTIEANDNQDGDIGKYRHLFDSYNTLIQKIGKNNMESDVERLELMDISRSVIMQYSSNFKQDGVSYKEMNRMLDDIEEITSSINATTVVTEAKKTIIKKYMRDTKAAVEAAYSMWMEDT